MSENADGLQATTLTPASDWGIKVLAGGLLVSAGGLHVYGGLYAYGGCTGCTIAYTGLNSGTAAIHRGDLVAAAGVDVDATTGEPILLVRLASQPNDAVIGVALGAAKSSSEAQRTGANPGQDRQHHHCQR